MEQLVNSVPQRPSDPDDEAGPTSNSAPARNDASRHDRNRVSGPIRKNSVGISSQEQSSSSVHDPVDLRKTRKNLAWKQVLLNAPPLNDVHETNPTVQVIVRWSEERALRRLRSDRVVGLPDQHLLAHWAEILDGLGVTSAGQITMVLDRARAVADRAAEWTTWSFLTLQIQLAAERMHRGASNSEISCVEASGPAPEDAGCERVQAKTMIRTMIGEIPFANWFEPSRQAVRNGGALTIAVPDEASRYYLDTEYREVISMVMSDMGLSTVNVVVDRQG